MATSIIKTDEIRRLNDTVLMSDGVMTANVDMSNITLAANHAGVKTALNASGDAPVYACRAWVNFNGKNTVSIRDSGNVTSITDNGSGDYTINFTTAMEDANYAVVGTCSNGDQDGVAGNDHSMFAAPKKTFTPAAGSIRVGTRNVDSNNQDYKFIYAAIFR